MIRGDARVGPRRRWLVVGIIIAVVAILAVGYVGAALVVYDRISRVGADCGGRFVGNTPASWRLDGSSAESTVPGFDASPLFVSEFTAVRIRSHDEDIELAAWWLPPDRDAHAPVIVVVHGRGSCKRDPESLAPAGMLHRHGYGVLLLDLRDHGASTIEDGRYAGGTEEYRDVRAAVDWLVAQGAEPGRIGAVGTSMGAATVIIGAGQDERIRAVWEDSGYADIERRVAEELDQRGFPRWLAPAGTLAARIVSGDDLGSHTVLGELARMSGRHLFITHGASDEATFVSHAHDLTEAARAAGVRTEQWIVPDAEHLDAMFLHPQEYEERLAGFFAVALENGSVTGPERDET